MSSHIIGTPYKQFRATGPFDVIVIGSGIGGLGTAAILAKAAGRRVLVLEVLAQDYVQVARAKGLSEKRVIFKHALRNSLIPQVTILASILPGLIGGSVIIETIFSIPGLGQLGFESVLARDYPTVLALFTVSALLTLIGILISDLLLAAVDPRIVFGRRQQ